MKKIVPKDAVLIPAEAEKVFKGQIYDTYQWQQEMFDGSRETFEMLRRPDTVTVIPIAGNRILAIKDTQPHVGTRLSFPGGRVDADDRSTLNAAKREIKEETGYEFDNWRLVNVTQPHAKLEWFIYFYVASGGRKTAEPHLDAGERINLKELTFDQAKSFVVTKSGYLGESEQIFERANTLVELTDSPEFEGAEIER